MPHDGLNGPFFMWLLLSSKDNNNAHFITYFKSENRDSNYSQKMKRAAAGTELCHPDPFQKWRDFCPSPWERCWQIAPSCQPLQRSCLGWRELSHPRSCPLPGQLELTEKEDKGPVLLSQLRTPLKGHLSCRTHCGIRSALNWDYITIQFLLLPTPAPIPSCHSLPLPFPPLFLHRCWSQQHSW